MGVFLYILYTWAYIRKTEYIIMVFKEGSTNPRDRDSCARLGPYKYHSENALYISLKIFFSNLGHRSDKLHDHVVA